MDLNLNFPETASGGEVVELKNDAEEIQEKEMSKEESIVRKRASTRAWSLLASEKITKLNDEVYDWEYDRKRKRRNYKIESEVEDTGLGGVDENAEGQSPKKRRGRKSKARIVEEKNVEAKTKRGRKRKVVNSELGGPSEGNEKNVEDDKTLRRSERKKSEEKNAEGQSAAVRDDHDENVLDSCYLHLLFPSTNQVTHLILFHC